MGLIYLPSILMTSPKPLSCFSLDCCSAIRLDSPNSLIIFPLFVIHACIPEQLPRSMPRVRKNSWPTVGPNGEPIKRLQVIDLMLRRRSHLWAHNVICRTCHMFCWGKSSVYISISKMCLVQLDRLLPFFLSDVPTVSIFLTNRFNAFLPHNLLGNSRLSLEPDQPFTLTKFSRSPS